jgi:hypothetical protein
MINTVEKIYLNGTWTNIYKVIYINGEILDVPHNEANRHYQEILEWVAEGNTIIDNGPQVP